MARQARYEDTVTYDADPVEEPADETRDQYGCLRSIRADASRAEWAAIKADREASRQAVAAKAALYLSGVAA